MARKKKDGKRARGIQGKCGKLYIVTTQITMENGKKVSKNNWISTGLDDTPANIKTAIKQREKIFRNKALSFVDMNITMSDFIDSILAKKERTISDTTFAAYYYRGQHIKTFFGGYKVRDINENLIADFLDSLFITYKLHPRTSKDIRTFLGLVMDQAVKEGLVPYNPVKEVPLNAKLVARYSPDKTADEEFFSYEEAECFLHRVESHELYELFYMTLFFGLRREEVLGLRWSSIDLKKKTMTVNHTVTKGTQINRLNTTKTKASARSYPLTDDQVKMLEHLKAKETQNRKLCGDGYTDNDYVFKHVDGTLFYPDHVTKAFSKVIKNNPDLPQRITFHGLRTSCVSILVHDGMDIKSIKDWVGHSSIDTTLKWYTKAKEKESKVEVSENMSSIIQMKKY